MKKARRVGIQVVYVLLAVCAMVMAAGAPGEWPGW